jgi:hypothetical protein
MVLLLKLKSLNFGTRNQEYYGVAMDDPTGIHQAEKA